MKKMIFLFIALASIMQVWAKEPDDSTKMLLEELRVMDSIESTLNYQTGKISLSGGIAELNIPDGFKFLGPADAKRVLEDIWGNPPSATAPLGLLFPVASGATDPGGYAFVVNYEAMGYVKDGDADKIDYDDLLKDLKKSSEEENKEREALGLYKMDLVGWASAPFYDKERKVLHWAKEFSIPGRDENTLNYDIRVLGRKGVLVLQAISGMAEIDSVKAHINDVLSMANFTDGNKYGDFNSKTDEVAAWTIGGLVAGKILAKAGFFAVILKFIKPILIGLALLGGAIWRFISGRKKKQEEELVPQTIDETTGTTPGT